MAHAFFLVLLAASLALAVGLLAANIKLRTLRTELHAARAAQPTSDIHGTQQDIRKDEFVANLSHELRTPLTSIRGALGLLSSGLLPPADPRAQTLFHIAVSNTDRLIRLSGDLLDLDRISSGQAPLQLRRCSMRELAQQAIETMTPQADAARIRLHLVLAAPPGSLFFDGDCDRILQVLTNLLSNAIKFSPPSSIVEIRIDAQPDTLRLCVSDSGRGIPPDKLTSIFGRFEQVETADAREKGGAGLGLAICKTIMQQHNGLIWAESNPQQDRGPGASFFLTFPRTSRQHDALPAPNGLPRQGTILLCDPNPALRNLVAATIQRHGYRVLEASTVDLALTLAAAHPVDAILLDLATPSPKDTALVDWLRPQPAIATLPLIVYSVPDQHPDLSSDAPPQTLPSSEVGPQEVPGIPSHIVLPFQGGGTTCTHHVQPHEVEDLVLSIVHRLQAKRIEAPA